MPLPVLVVARNVALYVSPLGPTIWIEFVARVAMSTPTSARHWMLNLYGPAGATVRSAAASNPAGATSLHRLDGRILNCRPSTSVFDVTATLRSEPSDPSPTSESPLFALSSTKSRSREPSPAYR